MHKRHVQITDRGPRFRMNFSFVSKRKGFLSHFSRFEQKRKWAANPWVCRFCLNFFSVLSETVFNHNFPLFDWKWTVHPIHVRCAGLAWNFFFSSEQTVFPHIFPFRKNNKNERRTLGCAGFTWHFFSSDRNGFRPHFPFSNENENERRTLFTDNLIEIVKEIVKMSSHYIKTPTLIRAYVVYFNFWTIRYSYSELQTKEAYQNHAKYLFTHQIISTYCSGAVLLYFFRNTCFLLWHQWAWNLCIVSGEIHQVL